MILVLQKLKQTKPMLRPKIFEALLAAEFGVTQQVDEPVKNVLSAPRVISAEKCIFSRRNDAFLLCKLMVIGIIVAQDGVRQC